MKTVMSTTSDGSRIRCNGEGCHAEANTPVALHPLLSDEAAKRIDGWLFVACSGEWRHYCPACLGKYLDGLLE